MGFKAIGRTITGWVGGFSDLDTEVRQMFYVAKEVRLKAQAEFSHYLVGVAVRSERTGNVYRGCNVERASYTQTTHGEQNAVDSMVSYEGKGAKLSDLVLLAGPENRNIILPPVVKKREICELKFTDISSPCGHCLQIIWENCLGDGGVRIYGMMPTGEVTIVTMDNAFPLKFGPADLGVTYGE